jgi:hypothetical protein
MTTEVIVNGGFEDGSGYTGWTGSYIPDGLPDVTPHAGALCANVYEGNVTQSADFTAIPISEINTFGFYVIGNGGDSSYRVKYSDGYGSYFPIANAGSWTYINVIPNLVAGKSVVNIDIHGGSGSPMYVDDVTLLYTPVITYALDVLSALKVLIASNYSSTDVVNSSGSLMTPDLADTVDGFNIQLDEFNTLYPRYQLVLINGGLKSTIVAPYVYKMEQSVMLDLHVRPVRNDPDSTIPNQRAIFEAMKVEIQNILTANQFNALFNDTQDPLLDDTIGGSPTTTYYSVIEQKSWSPSKIPHGFGKQKDPLEMTARLSVVVTYYLANGAAVNISSRLVSVSILNNSLTGLVDGDWEDMDQWVQIKIPKGPVIEQGLIGPHVDGIIRTADFRSLQTCLMGTEIPENLGHYPINIDNSKTLFSTTIPSSPEFIMTLQDTYASGASPSANFLIFNFYNVRIKQIKMVKADIKGTNPIIWEIHFMSDYYYVGSV